MKIQKKLLITFIILLFILISCVNSNVLADTTNIFKNVEYSESYKKWLELPDEEKQKVIMPRMYDVPYTLVASKNPIYKAKMSLLSLSSTYSLQDTIASNLAIRNQETTGICWAIAALSSLETNLALANKRNNVNESVVYDFSERHMEYATSKTFKDGATNDGGYNREVGSGGNTRIAESYLTNGTGAIKEADMQFQNNTEKIDINDIKNKTIASQVYDTVDFPDYNKDTAHKQEIMNKIKEHIQSYGSVYAPIHGATESSGDSPCYNSTNAAKYCSEKGNHKADHAVAIIGWDDNFATNKFTLGSQPKAPGAWIVRNSWGASFGKNGLMYVSYEDCNISTDLWGIEKATDTVDYENIYQYDEYYPVSILQLQTSQIMLCNVFNKKTAGKEFLTQVSLNVPETCTCKVYVNPKSSSKDASSMQFVKLKAGDTETVNAGYHTLEFDKAVEITGDTFAVVVQLQGTQSNSITFLVETKSDDYKEFDSVKTETNKCFIATGNNLSSCSWADLGKLESSLQQPQILNADSSIKAFTSSEVYDDALTGIQIINEPAKTHYYSGQNFEKQGMQVQANYRSKTHPTVELADNAYTITDGTNLQTGQNTVTISYEGFTVKQAITVEEDTVTGLQITNAPTKTQYKEGETFNPSGMVVQATYKSGKQVTINNYTITNGSNLQPNQNSVTISYGGQTVSQNITVTPNPLTEIRITKEPNKTNYVVGQNFKADGMVVTGVYQDGTTLEITDYTIEGGTNLTTDKTYVTIQYKDKTVTQPITVVEKAITQISVQANPSKLQYIQGKEDLNLAGGILKITYNDGTTENIPMTAEEVTVSGFSNANLGTAVVTVTYQNKTTQFQVQIVEEPRAVNSDMSNIKSSVKKVEAHTFTNSSKQSYVLVNVEVSNIIKNNSNDSTTYYYYLSSNANEQSINKWIKVSRNKQ